VSAWSQAPAIKSVEASAFTIPTEQPERDGTLEWSQTTLLLVVVRADDSTGIGYSYAHPAAAEVVNAKLAEIVCGQDPLHVGRPWAAMWRAVRNFGQTGLVSMAISAVDVALWDLKARLLDRALVDVVDAVRDATPVYGSGGFCNYADRQLAEQLAGWVQAGMKMKTGADPDRDHQRLRVARDAIGGDVELFVDANGAFARADALDWAHRYAGFGMRWYEEPVSSDDLPGLRLIRDRAPGGMSVAAGEYGWNLEFFHDHNRIEHLAFDGCLEPQTGGVLRPDRTRPGLGLEVRWPDLEQWRAR
jgi:L-alanine-DL-glutamate epimerase-like enolase superfamily enzyme